METNVHEYKSKSLLDFKLKVSNPYLKVTVYLYLLVFTKKDIG